jgi:hypothetical protein
MHANMGVVGQWLPLVGDEHLELGDEHLELGDEHLELGTVHTVFASGRHRWQAIAHIAVLWSGREKSEVITGARMRLCYTSTKYQHMMPFTSAEAVPVSKLRAQKSFLRFDPSEPHHQPRNHTQLCSGSGSCFSVFFRLASDRVRVESCGWLRRCLSFSAAFLSLSARACSMAMRSSSCRQRSVSAGG